MLQNKKRYIMVILGCWIFTLMMVFLPIRLQGYQLSLTNLMYSVAPWNSEGVVNTGPFLSDPLDSTIPNIYEPYYGEGYLKWNSDVALGVPVGIEVYLNPFNWFFVFPIEYALLLRSLFKLTVAYFGMCYLLKRMKLGTVAQAFGGVSYALSSALVMWHYWPHTNVMMFAPLALALADQMVEKRKIVTCLLQAVVVFLMLVGEMPTYAAYVIYMMGFYVLFITISIYYKDIRKILSVYIEFGVSIVLGVIAALPYLYSLVGQVVGNGYADSRMDQGRVALGLKSLSLLILPYDNLFGAHPNEEVLYFGVAGVLLLSLVFVRIKEKRKSKIIFWMISFAFLMIFAYTHWLDEIYVLLPGINTSLKSRIIAVACLIGIVIGAVNLDDILQHRETYCKNWLRFLFYAVALLLTGLAVVNFGQSKVWIYGSIGLMIAIIVLLECCIYCSRERWRKTAQICIMILVVCNMSYFIRQYLPYIDKDAEIIPEATDSIVYLQENLQGAREYAIGEWVLFPNTNVFYGISSLTAHTFVNTNKDITDYLTAVDDTCFTTATNVHGKKVDNYNLLRYAGVKYIVKQTANTDVSIDEAEKVYNGEDGLEIYEIDDFADRFYLSSQVKTAESKDDMLSGMSRHYVKDMVYILQEDALQEYSGSEKQDSEYVELVQDDGDEMKLNVHSDEKRMLVFNDYYDGNWKAYIDGQSVDVMNVNDLFQGVTIEKGDHEVVFIYDTGKVKVFLVVTVIELALIAAAVLFLLIKERKKTRTLT